MTIREFDAILVGNSWRAEHNARITASSVTQIINTCATRLGKGANVNVNKLVPRQNLAPRNPFYRAYLGIKSQ